MTTDLRDLCARMAEELDYYRQFLLDDRSVTHRLADEARAALADPEPPSLKEQALGAFSRADKDAITNPLTGEVVALRTILSKEQSDTIRRALESLPS